MNTQTNALGAAALSSTTFTGGFKTPEYIENQAELDEDLKIPDDVRNFWEPATPQNQNNQSPLLTTPGIETATDLVGIHACTIHCFQSSNFVYHFRLI